MIQVSRTILICEKCMNSRFHMLLQRSVFVTMNSIFTTRGAHRRNVAIHLNITK